MNIIWYGQSCFRIQSKDITLITDPFDKKIGLKPPYGAANIVTISHDHYDHNNYGVIKGNPFIVDGVGEYEINKVIIKGIKSYHDNKEGKERGANTIYAIEMEGIAMCHLGDLGQESLTDSQLEKIGQVDILFAPIGGIFTIDQKSADVIISQIEPRIIIPMHYKIAGLKGNLLKLDSIDKFSKEHNVSASDKVSKFSIKKKDLPQEESKVVLMDVE